MDEADIEYGTDWMTAIGNAIESSDVMVCVLDPKYISSKYCFNELTSKSHPSSSRCQPHPAQQRIPSHCQPPRRNSTHHTLPAQLANPTENTARARTR